jgi:hypothetical protein
MNPLKAQFANLQAATEFANGAIVVDDFDRIIFDDLIRSFPLWGWVPKVKAVGDYTNGFLQSAMGTARFADKRNLLYSATSPTRSARTPQEMKAITRDLVMGLYDRSVYAQQGKRFGDLTAKDISDIYNSMLYTWNDAFFNGDANDDPLEFNGLKVLLAATLANVLSTVSVVKTIQEKVVAMMNSTTKDVMPTAILTNARVRQICVQEYRKAGDKMPDLTGSRGERYKAIDTAAGDLPLILDRFCSVIAGTPNKYPLFIVSQDKLGWYYIEPLGEAGPDPKVLQLIGTTNVDEQFKGVMFGAMDLNGAANHHAYLTVEDRTTVVDPTA